MKQKKKKSLSYCTNLLCTMELDNCSVRPSDLITRLGEIEIWLPEHSEVWNDFYTRTDLDSNILQFGKTNKRECDWSIQKHTFRESKHCQFFTILSNARTGRIKWNQKVADSNNWNVFLTTMTLPEAIVDAKVYTAQNTSEHIYKTKVFRRLLCVKVQSLSWK